jgi:hypothetical protein
MRSTDRQGGSVRGNDHWRSGPGSVPFWALLILSLVMACGGGGGSTPHAPPQDTASDDAEGLRAKLLESMEMLFAALAQETDRARTLEVVVAANQLAGMLEGVVVPLMTREAQENCTTLDEDPDLSIMTFDGSEACQGISGTLEIAPAEDDDPTDEIRVATITLIDFSTGDGCLTNGEQWTQATRDGPYVTAVCSYADLDICGQWITGELVISGDTPDRYYLQLDAQTYSVDDERQAAVELQWQPTAGRLSGDGVATLTDGDYRFQVSQVRMDDGCGLPIDGILTITAPDGEVARADFADTSCEIPVATVEYQGRMEQWTLAERPRW